MELVDHAMMPNRSPFLMLVHTSAIIYSVLVVLVVRRIEMKCVSGEFHLFRKRGFHSLINRNYFE